MPYQITIDHPNLEEGTELTILGLGTFAQGGTYDISDEQAAAFQAAQATDVGDFNDEGVYVPNMQLGPALDEANIYGVKVSKSGTKSDAPQAGPVASTSDSGAPADTGGES